MRWVIDADHSCAAFAVRHMALARVRGQFNRMKGTIDFDPNDRSHISVAVEIDVASVTTGIRKRDEHLLTDEFFDQRKYPEIVFTSTKAEFVDGMRCRVSGNLTMHGITRPVVFDGEYAGPRKNPYGDETTIGFSGALTVNREDFGILWGSSLMAEGGFILGKEVEIFLDIEADLGES